MVSELIEFKGRLNKPIHAPSPKSVGRNGGVLGKNPSPTSRFSTLYINYGVGYDRN